MKFFSSEFIKEYRTYSFGYTQYGILESPQDIPEIYNRGFLPFSANPSLKHVIFYMARSLRVNLSNYRLSSENKRIEKKVQELNPQFEIIEKADFDITDSTFESFCLNYASARFSNSSMTLDRFRHIMQMPLGTHIVRFYNNDSILGYVFTVIEGRTVHYWYSFFELDYLSNYSLGKYMMSEVIKWASEQEMEFVYLGTCYGTHSLYKVRDFKGVEYWDGSFWSSDVKYLKNLCKSDQEVKNIDDFKVHGDPNTFLDEVIRKI